MSPITVEVKRHMFKGCHCEKELVFNLFLKAGVSKEGILTGKITKSEDFDTDIRKYTWEPEET